MRPVHQLVLIGSFCIVCVIAAVAISLLHAAPRACHAPVSYVAVLL